MDLQHYASRYIYSWKASSKNNWTDTIIAKYLIDNASVLDIWCASGLFFEKWKVKNIDYYGIDYNSIMVEYCKKKWLNTKQLDISCEPLTYPDNSFDFIYCSHVLEHILSNEQIKFFNELQRVLKKDWVLLLFTPTPYSWYFWDDPTHQRPSTHWSLEHLSQDAGLDVVECKYSNLRFFPWWTQKWLRLPPLRWFLWEVYLIAKKK